MDRNAPHPDARHANAPSADAPRPDAPARPAAPASAEPVVDVVGASLSHAGGPPVLTGVTFRALPGEAVALIGPNGAGKSTLLSGLLGLARHEAERWVVPPRGEIGLLPQHSGADLDFPVTLEQVVAMGRTARLGMRWPGSRDRTIVRDAIELVGLDEQRGHRFGTLSGGQRQRGLLARALAGEPRLLLLDEPFNGLDQPSRDALIDVIARLKQRGVALVITTHDLDLARAACERTLLVNGEQVAFDETECALTLELVERTFAAHAVEIDGHTLTTEQHHAHEHPGHGHHGRGEDAHPPRHHGPHP